MSKTNITDIQAKDPKQAEGETFLWVIQDSTSMQKIKNSN